MRISFLSNWIKRWRIWYYKRLEALDVYDLSQPLGKRGEQFAARYLQTKGCEIVRKNWKNGQYELDIVAQDGDVLVFVEVKTRSDEDINPPERNVNTEKQRRIVQAAESFRKMYMNLLGRKEYRFDEASNLSYPHRKTERFPIRTIHGFCISRQILCEVPCDRRFCYGISCRL